MAKKSKELLENSASLPNSKPNLKISRKTKSSPVSEPVTTDTISVDSISNAQKTQKETKQKRTIRININKSQNETKAVEKIEEKETKKINKPKRTLRLNLPEEPVVEQKRPKITEISINQNSSFFYAPSVFEKFNISVTDEDEIPEEVIETIPEAHDEIEKIETETIDTTEVYDFESNDVFDINSITITPIEDIEEIQEDVIEETIEAEELEDDLLEELIQEALEEVSGNSIEENIEQDVDSKESIEENIDQEANNEESIITEELESDLLEELIQESLEEEISEDSIEENVEQDIDSEDSIEEDIVQDVDTEESIEEDIAQEVDNDELVEEIDDEEDAEITEADIENFFKDDSEEDSSMEELIEELSQEEQTIDSAEDSDSVEDLSPISEELEDKEELLEELEDVEENSIDLEEEITEQINEEDLLNTDDALLEALLLEESTEENLLEESNDLLLEAINEDILQEAAENMEILEENVEHAESKKNIIGKFFDSSIPSMVENGEAYFSKIKKSIFTNVSNVFKKFSYDEAELVKAANEQYEAELAQPEQTVSEIVQNLGTAIGAEFPIDNIEVQADPVATIAVPTIDEALLSSTPNMDVGMNEVYTNIITPDSNTTESVNIDDELLEEALLNGFSFEELENIENDSEEVEETSDESAVEEPINEEKEAEEDFDIEAYFGLNDNKEEKIEEVTEEVVEETPVVEEAITEESTPVENFNPDSFENAFFSANEQPSTEELISKASQNFNPQDITSLSQLLTSFNQTISTLSERIASLESGNTPVKTDDTEITETQEATEEVQEELSIDDIELSDLDLDELILGDNSEESGLEFNDNGVEEESEEPSLIDDFDAFQFEDIVDELSLEEIEEATDNEPQLSVEDIVDETTSEITDILSKAFSEENSLIDEIMKKELLSEVLSVENENLEKSEETTDEIIEEKPIELLSKDADPDDRTYDFLKIIDSLSKTITELEKAPDIEPKAVSRMPLNAEDGKAINILINKDDIFSISILNETYEIVADFDGISVLSENIHISTPKHNFYVQVGEKYIEIHNKGTYFTLDTSFEDIEFANAINNVSFAKKNNKIELSIKDAFKLSSVNNKVELSMLNKAVANLAKATTSSPVIDEDDDNNSSICDNKTLLISEETQKVYLPYTIDEVMRKLNKNPNYKTIEDVVENEYTLPLATFKMPIISRFKEAYRFMRVKEKSSVYAALDLALELMFNSNLNPAVIRAAKDLKELNIYLDCLYENEIEKFDCFKIIYKVLPKIQ